MSSEAGGQEAETCTEPSDDDDSESEESVQGMSGVSDPGIAPLILSTDPTGPALESPTFHEEENEFGFFCSFGSSSQSHPHGELGFIADIIPFSRKSFKILKHQSILDPGIAVHLLIRRDPGIVKNQSTASSLNGLAPNVRREGPSQQTTGGCVN